MASWRYNDPEIKAEVNRDLERDLQAFVINALPIYQKFGFSKDAALIHYQLEFIINNTHDIAYHDEDDDWKK